MPGASEPAVLVASVGVVEDGVVGVSAGGAAFGLGEEVIYNSAKGMGSEITWCEKPMETTYPINRDGVR